VGTHDLLGNQVNLAISALKEKKTECCSRKCIRRLLDEDQQCLRTFLEEWFQLDKPQKDVLLRFTIRMCSRWSEHTVRGSARQQSRFEFHDPLLGHFCRKAFAMLVGIGEATLARHTAFVHGSNGRFAPSVHKNTGQAGHHQIDVHARREVLKFLVEIASAVGEESPGRHCLRNEEEGPIHPDNSNETPVVFLPAMYSLRCLHRLYKERIKRGNFPPQCMVSWMTFCRIFHSKELSWLRIRSPRDDVCDICLLYRGKMAQLMRNQGTKATLEKLGAISSVFVQHRDLAMAARNVYRTECRKAQEGAARLRRALEDRTAPEVLQELLHQYEAHYSFDFAQNLWLPQLADTPSQFYFLGLRSINLFGIVDDGGEGTPRQANMLYDQATAGKGSSEVVSMLYRFLRDVRKPPFAARRLYFHADNCVGQNKNSTLIHFFLWCIATDVVDHVELKFMLKGHTKFSPDGGFGMIKKHYRRANVYTIEHVANVLRISTPETKRNEAIILGKDDFGDWKSAFRTYFTPLKGISSLAVFIFDKSYPLGEVRGRGYAAGEEGEEKFHIFNLLHANLTPDEILRDPEFMNLPKRLGTLEQPQIPTKKQWDLYEKVRPYVPVEFQDIICPQPNVSKTSSCSKYKNDAP